MICRPTLLALALLAGAAHAAPNDTMKPGLWETSSKVDMGDPGLNQMMEQLQQRMNNMPAEQRQAMEAAMAKHGAQMPAMSRGADGATIVKLCLTKEIIDRNKGVMPTPPNAHCTQHSTPLVNGAMTTSFSCTNPVSKGETSIQFRDGTSYTATMQSVTSANGQDHAMKINATGKWLGADCGSVKPLAIPAQK